MKRRRFKALERVRWAEVIALADKAKIPIAKKRSNV
jgi:hypothetical protein